MLQLHLKAITGKLGTKTVAENIIKANPISDLVIDMMILTPARKGPTEQQDIWEHMKDMVDEV